MCEEGFLESIISDRWVVVFLHFNRNFVGSGISYVEQQFETVRIIKHLAHVIYGDNRGFKFKRQREGCCLVKRIVFLVGAFYSALQVSVEVDIIILCGF